MNIQPQTQPAVANQVVERLRSHLNAVIVGQSAFVDRLLMALFADGHILVEGAPGLAKTKAIATLSRAIACDEKRIQFTPDLLPGDLTGTEVYRPEDGKMLANFALGLSDICGLAYSPKGQLFAVDFAWHDTTQGGLFQLIRDADDATKSTTRKIAELDKPTAMVFGADGNLYVTVIGTGEGDSTEGAGKVICFSGL